MLVRLPISGGSCVRRLALRLSHTSELHCPISPGSDSSWLKWSELRASGRAMQPVPGMGLGAKRTKGKSVQVSTRP